MLSAYQASVEFINAEKDGLGPGHRCINGTRQSEVIQHTKIFRKSKPCGADVTALMKFIRSDKSGSFTEEDHKSLMEVASLRLSAAVVEDGTANRADLHGSQKIQHHDYSYNYYTDAEWATWEGETSMRHKFIAMSKAWLKWGLVYPVGSTFRIGLATIVVASRSTDSPDQTRLNDLYHEFVAEFRKVRSPDSGPATFQHFPSQIEAFSSLFPGQLLDVVPCRVSPVLIRGLANKEYIPIKNYNRKIAGKQHPTQVASSGRSPSPDASIEDMFRRIVTVSTASSAASAAPVAQIEDMHRPSVTTPTASSAALTQEARIEDYIRQIKALQSPSQSPQPERRSVTQGSGEPTGPPEPSTIAVTGVTATVAGTAQKTTVSGVTATVDSIDALMSDYRSGRKKEAAEMAAKKRPSAEKAAVKAANKKPGVEPDDSLDEDSSEEHEEEDCDAAEKPSVAKAATETVEKVASIEQEGTSDDGEEDEKVACDGESKKGKMRMMARIEKSKADAKAKSKSKKEPPTASAKEGAKSLPAAMKRPSASSPATMKRPSAYVEESLSKYPRVDLKKSVYWGGGRIYKAKGNQVRAYTRVGDRSDKRFPIKEGDRSSLNEAWRKGCNEIKDDPRPRY